MPAAAIPLIALGISAVGTGVQAIQGADAAGEAKKQTDAQKAAEDKLLADEQSQADQLAESKKLELKRDADLASLGDGGGQSPFTSSYQPGGGMSMAPGFAAASKQGSSLFGGL